MFCVGKTPGAAGQLPNMSELKHQKEHGNKWDFYQWPGIPRMDGIEMRKMINDIDETIRMKKAGTCTGKWAYKMFQGTVTTL